MTTTRVNSKAKLMHAAVRIMARQGVKAATVRAIAREAGVTEAAVYRHYPSKEALYLEAFERLVNEMTAVKETIAHSSATLRQKLREWVRVSYESYDRLPHAFSFVLLMPHDLPASHRDIVERQGHLFINIVLAAQAAGEMPPMKPELALSHFTGLMLNVPRLIEEGTLEGPATQYTDEVAAATDRALGI